MYRPEMYIPVQRNLSDMASQIQILHLTRRRFLDFLVDDCPLLVPDADVEISCNDLDSDDSGRDESGYMHRHRIREGVHTWSFSYATLSYGDYLYLQNLFAGKETFEFVYQYPGPSSAMKRCRAYCSKHSMTIHNQRQGIFKNYKITIIEC